MVAHTSQSQPFGSEAGGLQDLCWHGRQRETQSQKLNKHKRGNELNFFLQSSLSLSTFVYCSLFHEASGKQHSHIDGKKYNEVYSFQPGSYYSSTWFIRFCFRLSRATSFPSFLLVAFKQQHLPTTGIRDFICMCIYYAIILVEQCNQSMFIFKSFKQ